MEQEAVLKDLQHNLTVLLQQYDDLVKQNEALQALNEAQRAELIRTHTELETLQHQHKMLATAYALIGDTEQKTQARRHLARLIEQVDKALSLIAE